MAFYAIRPGATGPWRNLGAILRSRHDEARKEWQEERARRLKDGIPLSDAEDGTVPEDPGEYDGDPGLDSVRVRFHPHAPRSAVVDTTLRMQELAMVTPDSRARFFAAERESREVMRAFVCEVVAAIDGLEDEAGPWALDEIDDDAAAALDAAGLLSPLYRAGVAYMYLSGEDRKNFGGPPRSTSVAPITIAVDAQPGNGTLSGVMAARNNAGGSGPNTKATHAPEGSPSATRGSPPSSPTTTPREAS